MMARTGTVIISGGNSISNTVWINAEARPLSSIADMTIVLKVSSSELSFTHCINFID